MPLAAGTRFGPYEILAPIGAGGMGEVYRARDTKLGRDVAIKVLPESFAHDAERMARFEREAQVLASLNHPHIATISRLGREERRSRAGDGAGRGSDAGRADRRAGHAAGRSAAHRQADRRRTGIRARKRHHPSRSETGQREADRRRQRQDSRLRAGEGAGDADPAGQSVDLADVDAVEGTRLA